MDGMNDFITQNCIVLYTKRSVSLDIHIHNQAIQGDNMVPTLTIVVPCYNEEAVFHQASFELSRILQSLIDTALISAMSTILFVDDGSMDQTWRLINDESMANPLIKGLRLAHNVGHQHALFAGMEIAAPASDCIISIDADLQDDVSVIVTFIEKFLQGYDIVYGVRDNRDTDTAFKRKTAIGFYSLMKKLGVNIVPNHADFRLMSKRAVDELLKYRESNLFLRGVIPLIGFPSISVSYDRMKREAGESKYPLKKMILFALNGVTSFSVAPIRLVNLLGLVSIMVSIGIGTYVLGSSLLGIPVSGWSSIMVAICFFSGVQLIAIGILGEYIGKIYQETKHRPKYAIEMDLFTKRESRVNAQSLDEVKK